MNRKANGDIVLRPWMLTIILTVLAAAFTWAGSAAVYKERVGENTRRLERIETTLTRVEKNQVRIATELGVELRE